MAPRAASSHGERAHDRARGDASERSEARGTSSEQRAARRCAAVRGARTVLGAPCSVLGARCSVLGARCSVLVARCSVLRARCSVLGARCSVLVARAAVGAATGSRELARRPNRRPHHLHLVGFARANWAGEHAVQNDVWQQPARFPLSRCVAISTSRRGPRPDPPCPADPEDGLCGYSRSAPSWRGRAGQGGAGQDGPGRATTPCSAPVLQPALSCSV